MKISCKIPRSLELTLKLIMMLIGGSTLYVSECPKGLNSLTPSDHFVHAF